MHHMIQFKRLGIPVFPQSKNTHVIRVHCAKTRRRRSMRKKKMINNNKCLKYTITSVEEGNWTTRALRKTFTWCKKSPRHHENLKAYRTEEYKCTYLSVMGLLH
jgi:predicted transcriptional regulator of viral defense system